MNVVVTEQGFGQVSAEAPGFEIDTAARPQTLGDHLTHPRIHIFAESFADGRIFTLARQLRLKGYQGVIRAVCNLLPDQFAMARRAGIDEVEISAQHAERCDERAWLARADWRANDYQNRLRGQSLFTENQTDLLSP